MPDLRAGRTLINLPRELPITMLVYTHDMRLVQELFPRTSVMDEGGVVANGLMKEILENEELLTTHGLEKPYLKQSCEKKLRSFIFFK